MGRFKKHIFDANGIDKRQSGYYSTPDFIAEFLTKEMLSINPGGDKVFDPAVGNEELLGYFFQAGKQIDSIDIIDFGKYQYSNFKNINFIDYFKQNATPDLFNTPVKMEYDYYIANPPYNCHELDYIKNNKKRLRSIFPHVGIHNMYSMFLSGLIDLAKEGALIGVIVSDSFLTASAHSALRQKILNYCSIHSVILCPTNLFWDQKADVRTCIIILQKGKQFQKQVTIGNRDINIETFKSRLRNRDFQKVHRNSLVLDQRDGLNQFIIGVPNSILRLFRNDIIGNLFDCITGISTGNDAQYISKSNKAGFSIPFYKNPGSHKFYAEPNGYLIDSFLELDKTVKDFMVRNKQFLYKRGIICSSMGLPFGACLLPENSTFGVNAGIFCENDQDIFWLISYLNSSLVTYFVRGILIRSNMVTSGYVSKIPVIHFSRQIKKKLSELAHQAILNKIRVIETPHIIRLIDQIIFEYIDLKKEDIILVTDFANNLLRKV